MSDHFLASNNLAYKQGQAEMEASQNVVLNPSTKPNFLGMAKAAGIDKVVL